MSNDEDILNENINEDDINIIENEETNENIIEKNLDDDEKNEKQIKFKDNNNVENNNNNNDDDDENNKQLVLVENNNDNNINEENGVVALLHDNEGYDMDSGFDSRPESSQENLKRKLYKQAMNINKISHNTPKEKRIHESVTKVFGSDDPPPGFGLIYPKYYYLEQKRPQPMTPLKVWRGFNGNIYFEPIHYHHLRTSDIHQQQQQLPQKPVTQHSQRTLALTDKKLSRAKTEGDLLSTKSKNRFNNNNNNSNSNSGNIVIQQNTVSSSTQNIPNSHNLVNNNNNNNNVNIEDYISNEEEYIFITQPNNPLDSIDYHRNLTSISSFIQQNRLHQQSQQHSIMTTPFGHHLPPMSHISENHPQTLQPGSPKLTANFLIKSSSKSSNKKKEVILPNPNAASLKSKGPLKGLAYKEAKHRIVDKLAPINPLSYYTSNIDEQLLEQLNYKADQTVQHDLSQMPKIDKKRVDYKNMLKKIRKGITSNNNSIVANSQQHTEQQSQQHNYQQAPVKLARTDRTTSAYISATHHNRNNHNHNHNHNNNNDNNSQTGLMLNIANSSSDFNGVSHIDNRNNYLTNKRNKKLQIKGDKIEIDLIVNNNESLSPKYIPLLNRNKTSIVNYKSILKDLNEDIDSSVIIDESATIETYNSMKQYNLDKNKIQSMKTSINLTVDVKPYNLLSGLAGKRINPTTPDLENTLNQNNKYSYSSNNNIESYHIRIPYSHSRTNIN